MAHVQAGKESANRSDGVVQVEVVTTVDNLSRSDRVVHAAVVITVAVEDPYSLWHAAQAA